MGYSHPKKQLDLKEFLSTPAKKPPYKRGVSFRTYPAVNEEPPKVTDSKLDQKQE